MQQVLHEISKFKNRNNLNRKPLSRKEKSIFEDIKKVPREYRLSQEKGNGCRL